MPVNLKRLIWNAQKTFTCGHPAEVTGLSPVEVAERVLHLTTKTPVVAGSDQLSIEAQRNCTMLFHSLLRSTLHSKRVLKEYRLSPQVRSRSEAERLSPSEVERREPSGVERRRPIELLTARWTIRAFDGSCGHGACMYAPP